MDDNKYSSNILRKHFADHNKNLNEVIALLKRSRSLYVGHVTRTINQINKSMKKSKNCSVVKCIKDQLGLILEKLKITVNKFISVVEDLNEIEQGKKSLFSTKLPFY